MAVGDRVDPFRSFNFKVYVNGQDVAQFSEVSGLSSDGDAIDYRLGTDRALTNRKLWGLRKYANVTLKRGIMKDDTLWTWYATVINGSVTRQTVTVALMDEQRNEVLRWHIENAWPNKIEGPSMKASGNEVAFETIELVHEGLTFEKAS